jgi:hypothetical protein
LGIATALKATRSRFPTPRSLNAPICDIEAVISAPTRSSTLPSNRSRTRSPSQSTHRRHISTSRAAEYGISGSHCQLITVLYQRTLSWPSLSGIYHRSIPAAETATITFPLAVVQSLYLMTMLRSGQGDRNARFGDTRSQMASRIPPRLGKSSERGVDVESRKRLSS